MHTGEIIFPAPYGMALLFFSAEFPAAKAKSARGTSPMWESPTFCKSKRWRESARRLPIRSVYPTKIVPNTGQDSCDQNSMSCDFKGGESATRTGKESVIDFVRQAAQGKCAGRPL